MGAQGTATVDFGTTPVDGATIAVTGQAAIVAGSHAEAFVQDDSTGDNTALMHLELARNVKLVCESVVAGTGFTIRAMLTAGLATGTFKIRWVWN